MQILCRFSALTLSRYEHFKGLHIADVHPIFEVKSKILWKIARSFLDERTTKEERRLIFLAIANSTGLMRFQVPAEPSDTTILNCFHQLQAIAGWIEHLQAPGVRFPAYVVRTENRNLHNFKDWLKALEEVKKAFYEGQATQEHKHRMTLLEDKLTRLILSQVTQGSRGITNLMATWALDASEAPRECKPTWMKILNTPRDRIYTISSTDIKSLISHLEENLPHGSIAATAVMRRVRELLQQQADGLGLYEILTDDDSDASPNGAQRNEAITSEIANTPAAITAAIMAPIAEPVPANYGSKVSYLIAKAQWNLAQNALANAANNTVKAENKEQS